MKMTTQTIPTVEQTRSSEPRWDAGWTSDDQLAYSELSDYEPLGEFAHLVLAFIVCIAAVVLIGIFAQGLVGSVF